MAGRNNSSRPFIQISWRLQPSSHTVSSKWRMQSQAKRCPRSTSKSSVFIRAPTRSSSSEMATPTSGEKLNMPRLVETSSATLKGSLYWSSVMSSDRRSLNVILLRLILDLSSQSCSRLRRKLSSRLRTLTATSHQRCPGWSIVRTTYRARSASD